LTRISVRILKLNFSFPKLEHAVWKSELILGFLFAIFFYCICHVCNVYLICIRFLLNRIPNICDQKRSTAQLFVHYIPGTGWSYNLWDLEARSMLPGDFVRVSHIRDNWLLWQAGISHVKLTSCRTCYCVRARPWMVLRSIIRLLTLLNAISNDTHFSYNE
jgi:hypothetical protein